MFISLCRPYVRSNLVNSALCCLATFPVVENQPTKSFTVALRRPQGMTGKTSLSNQIVVFN